MKQTPQTAIEITNLWKTYKLGQIGTGSFAYDMQSWWARLRGKEDPNAKIGTGQHHGIYGKGTFDALQDVNITIQKGESVGIIGHNGAGKSTLLKILSRITAPSQGEVYLDGRVSSMLEVGTGFHPDMTGRENIYMNGAILGMTRKEIDAVMEDIIEFSEIRRFIDTPVKRYSSGMFVRLGFSVAAHLNSDIVIVDEVLSVGDFKFQKKCIHKMYQMVQSAHKTVLSVSHNMNSIKQLCNRCIVLSEGQVIFDGDVDEAISIYYGNAKTASYPIEHELETDSYYKGNLEKSKGLLPEKFTFLNTENCIFPREQPLRFSLQWNAQEYPHPMVLRTSIYYIDTTFVGTSHSSVFYAQNPNGVNETTFEVFLGNVASGAYYMVLELISGDEDTDSTMPLKKISTRIPFEIAKEPDERAWLHKLWGHIVLPETTVLNP